MANNQREGESTVENEREDRRDIGKKLYDMEIFISQALRTGVTISGIVIAIGLLWLLLSRRGPRMQFPHTFAGIWRGLLAGHPYAVIDVGLVILILTPVFRVAASAVLFWREKDKLYMWLTLYVLFMLVLSFALGKAG